MLFSFVFRQNIYTERERYRGTDRQTGGGDRETDRRTERENERGTETGRGVGINDTK